MAKSVVVRTPTMKHENIEHNPAMQMEKIRLRLIEYAANHTLKELITKTLDEICEIIHSPIGFFNFVTAGQTSRSFQQGLTRTLTEFYRKGNEGMHSPIEQTGVWADCVRQKKPIIYNDHASLEEKRGTPEGHAELIRKLVVPIMRKDQVVAILGVGNKPAFYTEKDVEIASYLSDVAWEIIQPKKTEEALIESEKRYRRLFESAKDGIMILNADTGMVVDANPFLLDLLGSSQENLQGKFIWDIGTFKNITSSKEAFKTLQDNEYIRYDDMPLETTDGRTVEVEFVSNVYLVDHTRVIQCNIRDISARKRAEAEHERMLLAIEQVGDMIVITGPEGDIQYVNPAFERVTGYTRQEVIGQNPRMFNSGKQNRDFYQNLWKTIYGGNIFRGRVVNKRKNGTLFTVEITISPVRNPLGHIVSYVAVTYDITEHLQLAAQFQQAQKMESIGRLAGGVAHDYNNMLSVIIGYTEIALKKVGPSESLYADLLEIMNAAKRSAEITHQLLAFARKQTISPVALDMNETVNSMLNMLKHLIGEDIDLVWLPETDLGHVNMDPVQIDQILANLCVNARDAISGVGKVTIETHRAAFDEDYCADHEGFTPGEFVLLTVSDDGCGMDKEILGNIFEPFFTTKDLSKGTGLGLSTIYGIVKQNNGFINVYSEPHKGTTFNIYLPSHAGEAEKKKTEIGTNVPLSHGEMVLLVEDDPAIIKIGKVILEKLGYKVLTADMPSKALNLAREYGNEISLLITDVIMPGMNGRDLAIQLHNICPDIKTLFMSGYTADVITHRGVLEAGVHFIQKPFSMMDLGVKARTILEQK
jgi:two-component system, cell cycle sensor histidine kinase and response regulator CckA